MVSACSHAAFEHGKPGNAEEKRSPTELVGTGLASAWLAFSCVCKEAGA